MLAVLRSSSASSSAVSLATAAASSFSRISLTIPSASSVVVPGCRTNSTGRGDEGPSSNKDRSEGGFQPESIKRQVKRHVKDMVEESEDGSRGFAAKDWKTMPDIKRIPARFRLDLQQEAPTKDGQQRREATEKVYTDHAGLRFPTLETAENFDYHKDRGIHRVMERSYPIKVPGYRRLDPYLREYIYFLHALDPARFTVDRIAERYRLRAKTVEKVVKEWGRNRYLTRSGLTRLRDKQVTKEDVILQKKEEMYAKWVGWDQLGDEDDLESDDEALGEFKGWRSTSDWVRRQTVEVEMMSAFPMPEKLDPMPKRVDIDMVVDGRQHHKIINWIDPTDKVVF